MKYTEAVGKRLGELLKEAGVTQKQFSQKSSVSRVTVNRTIIGRVDVVTFETLIIFCKALDISLCDFFASELFNDEIEVCERRKGRRI